MWGFINFGNSYDVGIRIPESEIKIPLKCCTFNKTNHPVTLVLNDEKFFKDLKVLERVNISIKLYLRQYLSLVE